MSDHVRIAYLFFFRSLKLLIATKACFDEMEQTKGRDIAFVSDWFTKKKRSSKVVSYFKGMYEK